MAKKPHLQMAFVGHFKFCHDRKIALGHDKGKCFHLTLKAFKIAYE